MKSTSNIICGIQQLKIADEHFQSFIRDNPGTKGKELFQRYSFKINWILKDLYTHHVLPVNVREGIKREIESDLFTIPAITEKLALLKPEQREAVEQMIDLILKGHPITVELMD